jgi:hypothetical protein
LFNRRIQHKGIADDAGVMTDVIASPNFLDYFDTTKTSSIIGAINSTFSGGGKYYALNIHP